MKVSVVIPAYQAGDFIAEAIDSLLAQPNKEVEIIVVDDGSTDNTASVAARYPLKYVYQQNHGYPGVARNLGFQYCNGEYIAMLDADDLITPGRLELQAKFLDEHPEVGAVFTDYQNFCGSELYPTQFSSSPRIQGLLAGKESAVLDPHTARDILLEENFASPIVTMFRRELLKIVPGYHHIRIGEDLVWAHEIASHRSIGILKCVGALRRIHGNNFSSTQTPSGKLEYARNGIIQNALMAATESSSDLQLKIARKTRASKKSLARELANHGRFKESLEHAWTAQDLKLCLRTLVLALRGRG